MKLLYILTRSTANMFQPNKALQITVPVISPPTKVPPNESKVHPLSMNRANIGPNEHVKPSLFIKSQSLWHSTFLHLEQSTKSRRQRFPFRPSPAFTDFTFNTDLWRLSQSQSCAYQAISIPLVCLNFWSTASKLESDLARQTHTFPTVHRSRFTLALSWPPRILATRKNFDLNYKPLWTMGLPLFRREFLTLKKSLGFSSSFCASFWWSLGKGNPDSKKNTSDYPRISITEARFFSRKY